MIGASSEQAISLRNDCDKTSTREPLKSLFASKDSRETVGNARKDSGEEFGVVSKDSRFMNSDE